MVRPGLRSRIRRFSLLFAGALALIAVHPLRERATPPWALAGCLPGLAIGVLASRINVLRRAAGEGAAVGETDAVGAVVLVGYPVFLLFRNRVQVGG